MTGRPSPVGPVCFDLDGCLIDSTAAITEAIVAALEHLDVAAPPAGELGWCVGPPLKESMAQLLAEAGDDPSRADEAVDAYRAGYATTWRASTRVFDGIEEVLAALTAAAAHEGAGGRPLAVVTSKPLPMATTILHGTGLDRWFSAVHGPDPDHRGEAKSQTLQRALAQVWPGGDPVEATMVGDRSHDVAAGRACGTVTVGVTWGAGDRAELTGAGADHVVDTPRQLREVLGAVTAT